MNTIKKRSSMLIKALSLMLVMLLALSPTVMAQTRNPVEVTISVEPRQVELKTGDVFSDARVTFDPDDIPEASKVLHWISQDESIAVADETTGEVRAVLPGTTTVEVSDPFGNTDSIEVIVTTRAPDGLYIPSPLELYAGESLTVSTLFQPGDLTTEGKELIWENSDPSIATVESKTFGDSFEITALKPGTVTLIARSKLNPSVSPEVIVTVKGIPEPNRIQVSPEMLPLEIGDTFNEVALTFSPSDLPEASKEVTWESEDTTIATVDENGKITAVNEGNVLVHVRSKFGAAGEAVWVTVTSPKPQMISADPASLTMFEGDISSEPELTFFPEDLPESSKRVMWMTNDPEILSVDENTGLISALAEGGGSVMAVSLLDSNIVAYVYVDVMKATPTSITASPLIVTLGKGETFDQVELTVQPMELPDELKTVTWKSENSSIATVDANGKITAINEGSVYIIATSTVDTDITASISLTVTPSRPTVTANPDKITLGVGQSISNIKLTFTPANLPEEEKGVSWYAHDYNIANVNDDGLITGVTPGKTKIDVRHMDGNYDTIEVTVVPTPTSLTANPENLVLEKGQVFSDVELIFAPVLLAEEFKTVTWESKDSSIATVDANGKITAINSGDTEIIVRSTIDTNIFTTIFVQVPEIVANEVVVTPNPLELEVGETFEDFNLSFSPVNAIEESKEVVWHSQDESIVRVDYTTGKITAISEGTATIRVSLSNGNGYDDIIVNVVPAKPIIELGSSTIKVVQAKRGKITDLSKMLTQNFKITAREYNPTTGIWSNVVLNVGAGGNVQMSPTPNLNKVGTYNFNLKLKDSDGNWVDFNNFIIYVM